jgi:hypothetical protein
MTGACVFVGGNIGVVKYGRAGAGIIGVVIKFG